VEDIGTGGGVKKRAGRVEEEVMRGNTFARKCAALLLAMNAVTVAATPNTKPAGTLVFEQLKTLVGEWQGRNASGPVKITYTLVSGGTALMERLQPKNEAEMITMYSADGDSILVTHYCSEGNQPSMKSETLKGIANKYSFSLVNVSGLKAPDDGHMVGLVLTLVDKDHLTQEWTYQKKGKTSADLFQYTRKPEKAATVVSPGN
jgi:hypothetical protein